jgi:hypothetical protein
MILDLVQRFSDDLVQVTAQYSNAVLVAIMPYISDAAHKLDLPVPQPVTAAQVLNLSFPPVKGPPQGQVILQNGWCFCFRWGYVDTIQSPNPFTMLQDPDEIPRFYGRLNMSKAEAVQLARDTLKKLGIPLESVFAEQEPNITGPHVFGTNVVPRFRIIWPHLRGGDSVEMEINADRKRVERICLRNESLERPPPKVSVVPSPDPHNPVWPEVNPEYARRLVPIMLRAIDDYGQKLALPVPRPLTTNHVARIRVGMGMNGAQPYSNIYLTNGWHFLYTHSMVNGYEAPDTLMFGFGRGPMLVRDYAGKWNMTEAEAIKLVRQTLAKLHYPSNHVHLDVKPEVQRPPIQGIPRFALSWTYPSSMDPNAESWVWAEVDAAKGQVKALNYDDKHYWQNLPIDAPFMLPMPSQTNTPPPKPLLVPRGTKPPAHPLNHPIPLSR